MTKWQIFTAITRIASRIDQFIIAIDCATSVVSRACETKEAQELIALCSRVLPVDRGVNKGTELQSAKVGIYADTTAYTKE
jgi:hypothetical protein